MTQSQLVLRSLVHHWRTNLAVLFGVLIATSVIGGALVVGDSVRESLRQMTLKRLGKIDYALSGPRFVREVLIDALSTQSKSGDGKSQIDLDNFSPAIVVLAGLEMKKGGTTRRAGQVNVYGVEDKAWSLIETEGVARPDGTNVVLNASAAEAIGARVGDEVTLWIEIPSVVPRDTLMGKKDNDSQEITLTVTGIASATSGLGRLGLMPTQAQPVNAFVDLRTIQARLGLDQVKPSRRDPVGKPARINTIFAHEPRSTQADPRQVGPKLISLTKKAWSLADLNLRIVESKSLDAVVLESEQMILEDKIAEIAEKTAQEMKCVTSPVMVYLANKMWNPKIHEPGKKVGYSMYSTVAGLDVLELEGTPFAGFEFVGEKPTSFSDDDVILNEFLATDLQVNVGDEIKFTYHTIGSRGELPELERSAKVRGIVKMTGAAIDRTLTPEVKGITDVDSLADWDQPFPMNLDAVTPRDDQYWDDYRATPKMFLPIKTAKALWPSRYGSLTSLRVAYAQDAPRLDADHSKSQLRSELGRQLLDRIEPTDVGVVFQPIKAIGLHAASGSTDFSGLFVGFSLFLIVAATILIGLLFRLGIEQRVRDLGLLGALGFTARRIQRIMLLEGIGTILIGGMLGILTAIGYAQFMIHGLTHWWVGAIGTREMTLSVQPQSLMIGFAIAVLAAAASVWFTLRQLRRVSPREQLAGVIEKPINFAAQLARRRRVVRRAVICLGLAAILIVGAFANLVPAQAAYFAVGIPLLVASLSLLSSWLLQAASSNQQPRRLTDIGQLGLRNAARQRQRSVMTMGMIATATFLIVTVAAFRRDPTSELPVKKSGNGGFTLVAQSSSPVLYDLNTPEGRNKLQINPTADTPEAKALATMHVVPFRVKPGEDASCLNLFQTKVPTILGVPQSLIDDDRFVFASGSWKVLNETPPASGSLTASEAPIPVLGDMNTLMFSLHKQVGQTISIPNEDSPQHQLVVKGMFQDSIFQGVLVMSEENFLRLFPEQKGFQYFLIDVPVADAEAASSLLETQLSEYGFDAEPVAERLTRFLSVQNTYLSTFQTLGGLGLLLGTFGLATVMLRNVLERQSELALLRAIGFRRDSVAAIVLWESAFILLCGLAAGTGSAFVATSPNFFIRGASLPWGSLMGLLSVVFATGMLASITAVATAVRLPIVTTLRGD